MDSLVAGLVGALIGAGASVATVWIQARFQAQRERLRLVADIALQDHKTMLEIGKLSGRGFSIPSVTSFLHYHLELAKLLERGTLSPSDLAALTRRNRELIDVMDELKAERLREKSAEV